MDSLKIVQEFDFPFAWLKLTEERIAIFHYKDNQEITLENAIEIYEKLGEWVNKERVPVLLVLGEFTNYSNQTKEYSASFDGTKYSLAEAIIVKNQGLRIVAQMYLIINKPIVHSKFFTNSNEAIIWLKSFI